MDDRAISADTNDAQLQRILSKLVNGPRNLDERDDPEVAPLFPGFRFDFKLVAGTTPIEKDGPLDFYIDRPNGMSGWIINLTIRGSGRIFRSGKSFLVQPGDVVLFPPSAVHDYGRAPHAECWWHRWIYFQPRAYWRSWLNWETAVHGVHLLRRQKTERLEELDRLFVEVAGLSSGPNDLLSTDIAMNLLERILLLCASMDRKRRAREPTDDRVLAACRLIAENLHSPLNIDDIARHVCLSPSRLAHLFKNQIGTGIIQWRDGQRIQYACQLLRLTNTPVKGVAQHVGYDDALYFSRVFRKHTGMSPRLFRERHSLQ